MGRLVISFILLIAIAFSCDSIPDRKYNREYVYTVIDKKECIESHYNFITEKQVIQTVRYIIAKDRGGNIVSHKCSLKEYYLYEVGRSYKSNTPWR